MADQEQFATSLQENLVTVLAYNDKEGRILANTLNTGLMDPDFRTIAEACIEYWKKYDKAPLDHTADLLSHIIEDKAHRRSKAITRILRGMVALSDNVNTAYVLTQQRQHDRMQQIKAAIIDSAEKINTLQHGAIGEIEAVWHELLANNQVADFNPGVRGSSYKTMMAHMRVTESEFRSGVQLLDRMHVRPARKELFMWLGASGRGKTWALICQGAEALKDRKKVLHITLELDHWKTLQRYYQAILHCSKRDVPSEITTLDINSKGKLIGLKPKTIKPTFAMDQEFASDELSAHVKRFGAKRLDNLIIKEFPSGTLTLAQLNAYLDALEQEENFIPDLLIVDYAGIMQTDIKNLRHSHSANVLGLRAICVKRNIAGATAWQSNREGAEAKMVKGTHIAEAWEAIGHCDNIVSFSSSDREFGLGLCRGYVPKGRGERDKFSFLMTQSYAIGQFCIESHWLNQTYYEELKALPDTGEPDDE